MDTRFRIGTYIDRTGDIQWEAERYYPDDDEGERWVVWSTNNKTREDIIRKIEIYRAREAHDPGWEEV